MPKTELEQNIDFLLSAALHKCGSLEDAEDLVQETLLSALTFLSKGGVIEDMKAWLLTVLNRRFYDMLRKKYSKPTISCDMVFDIPDKDDALEDIIKSEEAENIRREIAYLSKLYREVIIRRYMKNQSVEQIARELNIPVGTVKSRLSGGREQIKKGFEAMESYTKQSYEPELLHVACSGRSGLNGEPYSIVNNDLISQNILIASYSEPITVSDLSRKIGIPAAYIEPLVQKLIDNELMAQIGSKVYTDFIIFSNDDATRFIPAQKEFVSTHFQKLWQPVSKGFEKLQAADFYKKLNHRQKNKLKYYFFIKCLDSSIYQAGSRIYNGVQNFPDRPNGGKWIAFGYRNPEKLDARYSYSGERWDSLEKYAGSKFICIHVYDTPLERKRYYWGKNGKIDDVEILKLLYILHENIHPEDVGFNLMLLENIPHLTEYGVLAREAGKTTVDIPVVSSPEYNEITNIVQAAATEIADNITSVLAEYLKNAKTPIPKHLKSVPEQKQYMQSMNCIHMMTVYEAINRGLVGQDVDFPCPPMLMVIDK